MRSLISDIPDDILSGVVFGFLKGSLLPLRHVSKRWNAIALYVIGSLRLRRHCSRPPSGYGGAIELDMTTECFDHHMDDEISYYLSKYRGVEALYLDGVLTDVCAVSETCIAIERKATALTTLSLGSNLIDMFSVEHVSKMLRSQPSITRLHLDCTEIGVHEVKVICFALLHHNTIEILDLSSNNVGNEGVKYISNFLCRNTSITTLNLADTSIQDEGAASLANALRRNTSLLHLDLQGNYITSIGANHICNALCSNSTLKLLNLESNSIGDDGALSFCDMLRVNTSLTELVLVDNDIGEIGFAALKKEHRNSSITIWLGSDDNI